MATLIEVNLWALGGTGLVAGILGSMLGVGGGILIVPILTLALHLPIHVAVGSSLVAIVASSCTAAGIYTRARITNVRLGLLLGVATTPGAIVGALVAAIIAPGALSALFGIILLYIAYAVVSRQYPVSGDILQTDDSVNPPIASNILSVMLTHSYYDHILSKVVSYRVDKVPVGLGASFLAGAISSLLGVGGGIINVPMMTLAMGVPIKAAIATSTFLIAITATVGAFIYYYNGYIFPVVVAPLIIGVVIGAMVGTELTRRVKGPLLRRIFGVFMFCVALLMFLRAGGVI